MTYRIDGSDFELPPRYSRQHTRCTPPTLAIGSQESSRTLQPASGARIVVNATADGELRIDVGQMVAPAAAEQPISPAK